MNKNHFVYANYRKTRLSDYKEAQMSHPSIKISTSKTIFLINLIKP